MGDNYRDIKNHNRKQAEYFIKTYNLPGKVIMLNHSCRVVTVLRVEWSLIFGRLATLVKEGQKEFYIFNVDKIKILK